MGCALILAVDRRLCDDDDDDDEEEEEEGENRTRTVLAR